MTSTLKRSKVELLKQQSNFLRGPIDQEIANSNPFFSQDGTQILKFHGCYQQKDRDLEKAKQRGEESAYSMMLRTRTPGGFIPWQLYLALDQLSDRYGNHTLRTTTRQAFQLHGILKQDLKTVIADIVQNLGSTVGACGDINRNVMAPPPPFKHLPAYAYAREYAVKLADLLAPQGEAYFDVWLDGEKAVSLEPAPEVVQARSQQGKGIAKTVFEHSREPIYGTQYMPRKFKIAIAVPGDNSVDLFTNDLGLVVILDQNNQLTGFNVYVGGGLGRSHNNDQTIVRLADLLGFVPVSDIYDLVKGIVAVQRDYGDRLNRRHARFKYILHDWGMEKFKQVLQDYYPTPLQPGRELPEFTYQDYLGWHDQGDGKYFVGISIDNGRVLDRDGLQLKTALRQITERYQLPIFLTPNHNLLFTEIAPELKAEIQGILDRCGIQAPDQIDPLTRYAMACPAFPTCGLAITESERILPQIITRLRLLLDRLNLSQEKFVVRMTGCPNGCARPYMAELGLVGSGVNEYQVWLGGNFNSTRLAQPYLQRMPLEQLEYELEPLLVFFRDQHLGTESFGDFCDRLGHEQLRQFAATYHSHTPTKTKDQRHRVTLSPQVYERLRQTVNAEKKSMREIVELALARYFGDQ